MYLLVFFIHKKGTFENMFIKAPLVVTVTQELLIMPERYMKGSLIAPHALLGDEYSLNLYARFHTVF